nr:hypothetical protein [Tanacetum cinerariifolium]
MCPKVSGKAFDEPPRKEEALSFIHTQMYGAILPQAMKNQALLDFDAYKTYHAIASGAEPPISRKSQKKSDSAISFEESPSKKKSTKAKKVVALKPKPTKKKILVKADRGNGNSGEEYEDDENDSKDNSDNYENVDNDANDDDNQEGDDMNDDDEETDSDRTQSDRIKILVLNQSTTKYYEEEEEIDDEETMDYEEDDEVTKELYDDVNVNFGNEDTDMTNADQGGSGQQNVSHESGFKHVEEDAHVTLTPVLETQKTDEHVQISYVSFDITSKFLNIKNPSPTDNKIPSLMEPQLVMQWHLRFCNSCDREKCYKIIRSCSLGKVFLTTKVYLCGGTSLSEFELTKILQDKIEESKSHLRADYKRKLYDALVESNNTDKDLFNTYGELFTLKRSQDNSDKDQDPFAGSDRGTKRRKSRKEAEISLLDEPSHTVDDSGVQQDQEYDTGNNDEQPADKETWISQVARAKEPRTSFDELMDTFFDLFAFVRNRLYIKDLTQEILVGPAFELLKGTCKSLTELEYHLEECSKATTERLDRHNFAGNRFRLISANLKRTTAVTRLTIRKKYDYNHLEEIEVHREDQKLYKFREDPKGVIYKDQNNRNRLMRADELHKFCDGTLNDVRSALNDIAKGIRMEYLPKRKWRGLDKQKAQVITQDIDKQLYERRLMRNLEKFIGGREYENELRLLERTI